jgi:hypothetical protein
VSKFFRDVSHSAEDATTEPPPSKKPRTRARKADGPSDSKKPKPKATVKKDPVPLAKRRGSGKLAVLMRMPLDIFIEVSFIFDTSNRLAG